MDKEDYFMYVCVYTLLFGHKKEWNNAVCSNMDGLRDHTKWSQKDKYPLYVKSKISHKWAYL